MSGIRRILASLCLALTVAASVPCRAESGKNSSGPDGGGATVAPPGSGPTAPGTPTVATAFPLKAQLQTTGTTSSGSSGKMSTKKKTWIIVGSILGAIAIGAAVSHHGGGGSSSGGGGY